MLGLVVAEAALHAEPSKALALVAEQRPDDGCARIEPAPLRIVRGEPVGEEGPYDLFDVGCWHAELGQVGQLVYRHLDLARTGPN